MSTFFPFGANHGGPLCLAAPFFKPSMLAKILSSKYFHLALGFLVSGGLIIWMLGEIEWSAVGEHITRINWWILLPMTGVIAVQFIFRALRWRQLVLGGEQVSLQTLWDGVILGNFANYILPLRAGEFARPFYLSLKSPIPFATAFISIVIERFFDLATVLLFFVVIVFFVPDMPVWVESGAFSLALLGACILAFILFASLQPALLQRWIDYWARFVPSKVRAPLVRFLANLILGASVVRSAKNFAKISLFSFGVWVLTFAQFWLGLFLFDTSTSLALAVTLGVIVALAVAAPSAPGFIGVYQVACLAAFAMFGIDKELAMAYAIVTHVHMIVLFLVYGPIILAQRGVKLGEMVKRDVN